MKNILITSAGQRVSLVRAFQKELRKISLDSKVYTVDMNPILAPACHASDGFRQVGRVTDEDYISELIRICKDLEVKIIIPTIDTELLTLAKNKEILLQEGIIAVVSELEFIQKCRDKRIINEFFTERGVDIPHPIDKNNPTFPLFIKPYDGSLSKDIYLIKTEEELKDFHLQNEKFMFMEYVDPEQYDEYTVDAYYDKAGALKCAVPRKRITVRAGEINKGVTRKNEILDFVKTRLGNIDGVQGCLTMQFFFNNDSKRIIGIEINPRFGGGYPLSYLAGANYPEYILQEHLLGESLQYFDGWEDNLLMLRYDDEILVRNYEA